MVKGVAILIAMWQEVQYHDSPFPVEGLNTGGKGEGEALSSPA